mgnify:CR=1 FL=1
MGWIRVALAALWFGAASAQAAVSFLVETRDLSPAEQRASGRVLEDALKRLPPAFVEKFERPVRVQWRDDLPANKHGQARRWRISIKRSLLADYDAARAAVLHELAHLHDRNTTPRISRDPRFLDLAGWERAVWRPGRRGRNAFSDRSPDAYERASPREYFAVNLEHYLLDAAYRCRRPDMAAYFDQRFGVKPSPAVSCGDELVFVQGGIANSEPLRRLDPRRIAAVDYLLADGNARPMSAFGHSMLRLVVCAPEREPGDDCRGDLQHHLVLSFRAFVDDLQISGWRGLSGGYPSRLFVLPLSQVIDEYTKVELRGLRSIPLELSRPEIAAIARRTAQRHWNYDGRYRFLTNNCAVETLKLLGEAVPRIAARELSAITPVGLLEKLRNEGLTNEQDIPGDADEAIRQGYRFAPADAYFDDMYAVAKSSLRLAPRDAAGWLALAPSRRTEALRQADLRAAAALLVLESAAVRQQEALALDELKRRYLRRATKRDADDLRQARRWLELAERFSRPAAWLDGVAGYGLPQADELHALERRVEADAIALREGGKALKAALRERLSTPRRDMLESAETNLALIGERLRKLAGEEAPDLD